MKSKHVFLLVVGAILIAFGTMITVSSGRNLIAQAQVLTPDGVRVHTARRMREESEIEASLLAESMIKAMQKNALVDGRLSFSAKTAGPNLLEPDRQKLREMFERKGWVVSFSASYRGRTMFARPNCVKMTCQEP